ncbi:MAG: elongation factor 4 [Acidobacteria bacterium]|nr:elongation factor 4 [Acidobacteriota bacterium]
MKTSKIRNFSIIAHIDHGKSTLADRILELTSAVSAREMKEQLLDDMDLERERGITIKAHAVNLTYEAADGESYLFNLIDTPGHVDFSYEVSRSLAACEGALLVVDATQGVEAQTLANAYLALENDLEIIPVINKIDLPSADPDRVAEQIEQVVGLPAEEALQVSAKTGEGVREVLEALVAKVPPPKGEVAGPLRALLFDAWYDPYRGVCCLIRVREGEIRTGQKIRFMAGGSAFDVEDLGHFTPKVEPKDRLGPGEVGFMFANIKDLHQTRVGDTVTDDRNPAQAQLPGFEEAKPVVFAGLYPVDSADYQDLRDALDKLSLNDASLSYEPDTSQALGFGFRCGYLGLLHMEIVQQRLEREFGLNLITTAPSVRYRVENTAGEVLWVDNPKDLPDAGAIAAIAEPMIEATILTRADSVGPILKLCEERRGEQKRLEYVGPQRVLIEYRLPLAEVVMDFYDRLKSCSRGYASFDYQLIGYEPGNMVKLDVLVNGEPVDALSVIVHADQAYNRGQALVSRLKRVIPRQLYEVVIQAAVGRRVISRAVVKALRKNVLAKCYGGDITRKKKLLEKQKEGKKRMKKIGHVEVPQEAFLAVLKMEDS